MEVRLILSSANREKRSYRLFYIKKMGGLVMLGYGQCGLTSCFAGVNARVNDDRAMVP